jgi:hypothetical protein
MIYRDDNVRDACFAALGERPPVNYQRYAHWLGQTSQAPGRVLNFVEILAAYWSSKKDELNEGKSSNSYVSSFYSPLGEKTLRSPDAFQ